MIESISKVFAISLGSVDQELVFFAVVVALSAYLATVRFYLVQRADNKGGKESRRKALLPVVPADALVTTSAVLTGVHALFRRTPHCVLSLGVWFFTVGGAYLFCLHFLAWIYIFLGKQIRTWFGNASKSTESPAAPTPTQVRKTEADISCNGQPLHVTLSLVVPAESPAKAPGASAER